MTDVFAEIRSILTRASIVEDRRQAARIQGDRQAEHAAEVELRSLWARHAELEQQARVA